MTPDEAWREGRAAFEAGDFHAAHEHWEVVWRAAPPDRRRACQGLIQLAAACYKLQQKEIRAAQSLLRRALEGLEGVSCLPGVDLIGLRPQVVALLRALEDSGPGARDPFDPAWLPRLDWPRS